MASATIKLLHLLIRFVTILKSQKVYMHFLVHSDEHRGQFECKTNAQLFTNDVLCWNSVIFILVCGSDSICGIKNGERY